MHTGTIKNVWTLVAFAMLAAIAPSRASADTYWINGGSGDAGVGTNWSSGLPLNAISTNQGIAYFTNNASYQVSYGNIYADAISYNATSGVVTNNISGELEVYPWNSFPGSGIFSVGDTNGSVASVVQVGAGQLYVPGTMYVGNNGIGSFTESGTNYVTVSVWLIVGGTNGSAGSTFVATNGAHVNANGNGTMLGYLTGSDSNTVIATGAATTYANNYELIIGNYGSFNTMRLENGVQFTSPGSYYTYLGNQASSSNNTLIVTGSNTLFSLSYSLGDFRIGNSGGGNTMMVSNGATARVDGSSSFVGTFGSVGNNALIVSGPGSTMYMTNSALNFYEGYSAPSNRIVIENGGRILSGPVSGGLTYIGYNASASNNMVTVTGSNSYWGIAGNDFRVGDLSGGNALIVSNGATAKFNGANAYMGVVGSGNNAIIVSGPGSMLTMTNTTTAISLGYQAPSNRLVIANGGQLFSWAGSGGDRLHVGQYASASGNAILVADSNSLWRIYANSSDPLSEFSLGYASGGNTLIISNGANVQFDGKYFEIGVNTANNAVTVTGAGSTFSNAAAIFYAGYGSSNNRLTIDNGGTLVASNLILGYSSVNPVVNVTGSNSLLSVLDTITIGTGGSGASLLVSNGAVAQANTIKVGDTVAGFVTASGGSLLVTNAAATGLLNVNLGSLTVTNGGAVVADQLTLAGTLNLVGGSLQTRGSTSSGSPVVGGGDSSGTWTMLGGSNTVAGVLGTAKNGVLIATNGAYVRTAGVRVGNGVGDTNGLVVLSGSGTILTNTSAFYLGYNVGAAGNTLRIENGAKLVSPGNAVFYIGYNAGTSNSTLLVTGTNSALTVTDAGTTLDFRVSNAGHDESLIVSNGGAVQINGAANVYVGAFDTVGNNSIVVTGPGSTMTMTNAAADLILGYSTASPNNHLLIDNGGRVTVGGRLLLGWNVAANSNNTMLVTGTNSFLGIGGRGADSAMYVGINGASNSVTISNGAAARFDGAHVYLGYYTANNNFLVTGPGSVFSNTAAEFDVGVYGTQNRLVIDNGGQVCGSNVVIGYSGGGNALTVTGTNSLLTAAGLLNVNAGSLTVTNGGAVVANQLALAGTLNLMGGSLQTRGSSGSAVWAVVGGGADTGTWTMLGGSNNLGAVALGMANNGVLIVTNGAYLNTSQFYAGYNGYTAVAGSNSLTIVTGPSTVWSNASNLNAGYSGAGNTVRIENGAHVVSGGPGGTYYLMGEYAGASNNTVMVTGSNSVLTFGGVGASIRLSDVSGNNSLIVSNGGLFRFDGSVLYMGIGAGNDSLAVSGPNSALVMSNAALYAAWAGANNRVLIDNGGALTTSNLLLGYQGANATANVTGSNSLLRVLDTLTVGSGNFASLVVSNGGVARADKITLFTFGGSITDNGGSLVATNATTTGFLDVKYGSLTLTNGGVVRVDSLYATNGAVSVLNLAGGSLWTHDSIVSNGTVTVLGDGVESASWTLTGGTNSFANGLRIAANATLTGGGLVRGAVTNLGTILVQNNTMTFRDGVTVSGRYISDPSTNTFLTNVTISASGTLEGGKGDLFDFKKSLMINSTNHIGFNLALSTVSFSGGGDHTNAVTGGDFGTNLTVYPNANFSYGTLTLASATDQLYFVSGGFTNAPAGSNALYVGQLNLFNNSGLLQSSLVSELHSPFNIYYLSELINPGNAYLNDQTFSLGGGFLMPFVPEPSALALLTLAGIVFGMRRRR